MKNHSGWPRSASVAMTSGAVPPKVATVTLYQAPMPTPRSSVGNSSLMMAGAMEAMSAYSPSPVQNTTSSCGSAASGVISRESGMIVSASAADHTSSCGLRPNRSESAPNGYCSTMNRAVPADRATKTALSSTPLDATAYGVSALKNV